MTVTRRENPSNSCPDSQLRVFGPVKCNHPVITVAHDLVAVTEKPMPLSLTGKQKVALMLWKGGYSHAEIADRMGLSHRETATRLIGRARTAEKAAKAAMVDFIGNQ